MYESVIEIQQSKTKGFRKYCCSTMFPQIWKQLTDDLHAMKIEDLTKRVQVLSLQMKKNFKIINSKYWK